MVVTNNLKKGTVSIFVGLADCLEALTEAGSSKSPEEISYMYISRRSGE